jgi:hypothetical protein
VGGSLRPHVHMSGLFKGSSVGVPFESRDSKEE